MNIRELRTLERILKQNPGVENEFSKCVPETRMFPSRGWQITAPERSPAPTCSVSWALLNSWSPLFTVVTTAASVSQWQNRVVVTETVGPTKPEIFIIRSCTDTVYQHLS